MLVQLGFGHTPSLLSLYYANCACAMHTISVLCLCYAYYAFYNHPVDSAAALKCNDYG